MVILTFIIYQNKFLWRCIQLLEFYFIHWSLSNALFYFSQNKFIENIYKFHNLDKIYITKVTHVHIKLSVMYKITVVQNYRMYKIHHVCDSSAFSCIEFIFLKTLFDHLSNMTNSKPWVLPKTYMINACNKGLELHIKSWSKSGSSPRPHSSFHLSQTIRSIHHRLEGSHTKNYDNLYLTISF